MTWGGKIGRKRRRRYNSNIDNNDNSSCHNNEPGGGGECRDLSRLGRVVLDVRFPGKRRHRVTKRGRSEYAVTRAEVLGKYVYIGTYFNNDADRFNGIAAGRGIRCRSIFYRTVVLLSTATFSECVLYAQ